MRDRRTGEPNTPDEDKPAGQAKASRRPAPLTVPPAVENKQRGLHRDEAAARIRELILAGEPGFRSGDILSETRIADRLNLTRTPIRQALSHLAGEGLVSIIPRVGTQVCIIRPEEMKSIMAIRYAVETLVVAELAKMRPDLSKCDVRLMSSANDVRNMPKTGKSLIVVAVLDQVIHFRIFECDGSMVVDTDAKRQAEQARQIEDLGKQLASLWPPHKLTEDEKARVRIGVASIFGHTYLGELRAIHERMVEIASSPTLDTIARRKFSEDDMAFHAKMAEMAPGYASVSRTVSELVSRCFLYAYRGIQMPDSHNRMNDVIGEHKKILDALAIGNVDEARESLQNHIRGSVLRLAPFALDYVKNEVPQSLGIPMRHVSKGS